MKNVLLVGIALIACATLASSAVEETARQPRTDRYGDPLPEGAIARLGTLRLRGCRGPVVFSPDGKHLVTSGGDGGAQAIFWDRATGRRVKTLTAKGYIRRMAFSPDGKLLAIVNGDTESTVNPVWDVASGEKLFAFEGDQVAFSADGKKFVAIHNRPREAVVCTFDTVTGRQLSKWSHIPPGYSNLVLSPDGRFAVAPFGLTEKHSALVFFDVAKQVEIKRLRYDQGAVEGCRFSRDGRRLVVAGREGHEVWDWMAGKTLRSWSGGFHHVPVFADDGRRLAWSSLEEGKGTISLWAADGESGPPHLIRKMRFSNWLHSSSALSADGKAVVLVTKDGAAVVLDVQTGQPLLPRDAHMGHVLHVAFTPDARQVVTRDSFGDEIVWEAATGKLLRRATDELMRGWMQPRRQWLQLTQQEQREWLRKSKWLDRDGRPIFGEDAEVLFDVLPSPGDRYLAASGEPRRDKRKIGEDKRWLRIWDAATRRLEMELGPKHGVHDVAGFSPDARTFVSTTPSGTIHLWEVATGRERLRLVGHRPDYVRLAFRPDGRALVSGGNDTQVFLWDVTGRAPDGVWHGAHHSPERLRQLWGELVGDHAARAYRAMWSLAAAPTQATALIQEHLHSVTAADPQQLSRLLADLDSDSFAARTKATRELERLGELAEPALRKTMAGRPTLEVRRRCGELLEKLSVLSPDRLRAFRAVRVVELLEHLGTAEARELLEKLAQGDPAARLTREARTAAKRSLQGEAGQPR